MLCRYDIQFINDAKVKKTYSYLTLILNYDTIIYVFLKRVNQILL